MNELSPTIRTGLKHRVICAAFPLVTAIFAFYLTRVEPDPFLYCYGLVSLIYAVIGLSSPIILTEGFNKTFPSSKHLSLMTKKTQRVLLVISAAVLCIPFLLRLLQSS